jgi:8-oxo-dGTP pyrophosphatase MutT (NUDIX family)
VLAENVDVFDIDHGKRYVRWNSKYSGGEEKRSNAIATIVNRWRQQGTFDVLKGWRNELYAVYCPTSQLYFVIERCAACLFGLVTYGIHMIGYIPATEEKPMRIWVPRRSLTKPTYPGKLDNTVAGGIGYPAGIYETLVKECAEEAGLDADYVDRHAVATGVVTYCFQAEHTLETEAGVYQPEVEYTYDLVMEEGTIPKPVDGEVQEFNLLTVDQVKQELAKGNFKYNTSLITVDFFIRHGIITPENESDFLEIVARSHRKLEYFLR